MASEPASIVMLRLITGFWVSQAIYAAVRLGIPDALSLAPQTAEELASRTGTDPSATYRLLRALAATGIFRELPDRRFHLSELGDQLRSDRPWGMHAMALTLGDAPYRAWGDLVHSVRTGEAAFDHAFGVGWFDYLDSHPDAAAAFDQAMAAQSQLAHAGISETYDFSACRHVLDIGGGSGLLLDRILRRYPHLTGVLFDRPRVIQDSATPFWAASPLRDRCRLEAGDFFEEIPRGADVHVLAMVLHNWDDERCVALLENCRRSLEPRGTVLVSELVLPQGNTPFFGKWLDLDMLVRLGGKERTEAEYVSLFERAGLNFERAVPAGLSSTLSLLVAH